MSGKGEEKATFENDMAIRLPVESVTSKFPMLSHLSGRPVNREVPHQQLFQTPPRPQMRNLLNIVLQMLAAPEHRIDENLPEIRSSSGSPGR